LKVRCRPDIPFHSFSLWRPSIFLNFGRHGGFSHRALHQSNSARIRIPILLPPFHQATNFSFTTYLSPPNSFRRRSGRIFVPSVNCEPSCCPAPHARFFEHPEESVVFSLSPFSPHSEREHHANLRITPLTRPPRICDLFLASRVHTFLLFPFINPFSSKICPLLFPLGQLLSVP